MIRFRRLALLSLSILISGCADVPSQHLVGAWLFDGTRGETAEDGSGNDNLAVFTNVGWVDGANGGELSLDGSEESVVRIALSDSLRTTTKEITVAARAFRTAEHNVALVAHGYPTLFLGFHGPQFKWQVGLDSGRKGVCYAEERYRAELNRWYHVAATFNGWIAHLYVDGERICSDWTLGGNIEMPEVPFTIGAYIDNDGVIVDVMSGRIDDVRIYNRALSGSEIVVLANPGL